MNYHLTAEKPNMTQPGVTRHIHYLENYYGVRLFEYNGRQLTRTRQAGLLKRHLDSVLTEVRALKEALAAADVLRLQVGATKTIGEFVLCDAVQAFFGKKQPHSGADRGQHRGAAGNALPRRAGFRRYRGGF